MEVRITFRSEVFIEGDSFKDIQNKWNYLPIFSAEALEEYDAEYIEVESVEDAETYEDLSNELELV